MIYYLTLIAWVFAIVILAVYYIIRDPNLRVELYCELCEPSVFRKIDFPIRAVSGFFDKILGDKLISLWSFIVMGAIFLFTVVLTTADFSAVNCMYDDDPTSCDDLLFLPFDYIIVIFPALAMVSVGNFLSLSILRLLLRRIAGGKTGFHLAVALLIGSIFLVTIFSFFASVYIMNSISEISGMFWRYDTGFDAGLIYISSGGNWSNINKIATSLYCNSIGGQAEPNSIDSFIQVGVVFSELSIVIIFSYIILHLILYSIVIIIKYFGNKFGKLLEKMEKAPEPLAFFVAFFPLLASLIQAISG